MYGLQQCESECQAEIVGSSVRTAAVESKCQGKSQCTDCSSVNQRVRLSWVGTVHRLQQCESECRADLGWNSVQTAAVRVRVSG